MMIQQLLCLYFILKLEFLFLIHIFLILIKQAEGSTSGVLSRRLCHNMAFYGDRYLPQNLVIKVSCKVHFCIDYTQNTNI